VKQDAKREAIRYWWEKALEALEAARRDLAAEAFSFAINRAYYDAILRCKRIASGRRASIREA
jgi:uncharacterized protein (UPF0332 family)